MKFILNFLFRRMTVDSIMAGFQKTVDDLKTVQERQTRKVAKQDTVIDRALMKRSQADQEARRAIEQQRRFNALIHGADESKVVNGNVTIKAADGALVRGFGLDDSIGVGAGA